MRLWSLHPKYLDAKGLVALWRETLLAQNVLLGNTKGYKNHPQLERFKEHAEPIKAIGTYLLYVEREAARRGYNFDKNKIRYHDESLEKITVTDGQMQFELEHLKRKLEIRDPDRLLSVMELKEPEVHPLFVVEEGGVAGWERV
jgi:hypothetical protein